jgi:hypothetical protein
MAEVPDACAVAEDRALVHDRARVNEGWHPRQRTPAKDVVEKPAMSDPGLEAEAANRGARLKRLLRPVMLLVALGFVVLTAVDLAKRWDDAPVEFRPGLVLLSLLPAFVSSFIQGLGWIGLAERMAHSKVPKLAAMALYLDSQLARYTPGKVGLPLVRMEGAPRLGLTRSLVGASVLVEMLSWTSTPLLVLSALGVLLLLAVDRARFPAVLRRVLSFDGHGPLVPLALPAIQIVYWLLWAAHGLLMSLALGAAPTTALDSSGFYVLAPVAGFVALLAPAGLGVREAVLLAGLAPTLGAAGAVGAAVLSRMVSLAADFGSWILVRVLARRDTAANELQSHRRKP